MQLPGDVVNDVGLLQNQSFPQFRLALLLLVKLLVFDVRIVYSLVLCVLLRQLLRQFFDVLLLFLPLGLLLGNERLQVFNLKLLVAYCLVQRRHLRL